jgi:hypothetical protein
LQTFANYRLVGFADVCVSNKKGKISKATTVVRIKKKSEKQEQETKDVNEVLGISIG